MKDDAWRVQDEKKNATKYKEQDMLRTMEHDVNLGIT